MITLQHALWKYREVWCPSNGDGNTKPSQPPDPNSYRHYWGWNEIPFDKTVINEPRNWTCFVIVLPPWLRHLEDALNNNTAKTKLVDQLDKYQSHYHLHPNESKIAVARQIKDPKKNDDTYWIREFLGDNVRIGHSHDKKKNGERVWSIKDRIIRLELE